MRILHVFPDSVVEPGQQHLGSTKDIRGRSQYFAERRIEVTELQHERSALGMLRAVRQASLTEYDAIVVEYPLSSRAAGAIRRGAPDAALLVRSENAELLHRIDWMRAMGPSLATAKLAARTVQTMTAEAWSARASDALLSISTWETEHYWPKMGLRQRAHWVPYYVPDAYLDELAPPQGRAVPRSNVCVCLTSSKRNPLIDDSVRGFHRAVQSASQDLPWTFVVTGDASAAAENPRIHRTGMLESPAEVLTTSRAVALLSDYGYGFKTKLLDAVVAGNRILVTPGLRRRVPPELDAWTITVDLNIAGSFTAALDKCTGDLPEGDPNALLRQRHHRTLDDLLVRATPPRRDPR